jgi:hypothetical protein
MLRRQEMLLQVVAFTRFNVRGLWQT